jgi:hypothetical protein
VRRCIRNRGRVNGEETGQRWAVMKWVPSVPSNDVAARLRSWRRQGQRSRFGQVSRRRSWARAAALGHLHPYAVSLAIGCRAPKAVIPWCAGRPVKSPFCAALWGKPHSRPTYSVWAEAGFPAFTLYACKSMLRFSFTRSSITSERTSLLFFFGKVLRYSMIACHSLTSIEELAPAPRTA